MMDELTVLQTVRLKGRVRPADLVAPVKEFIEAGLLIDGKAVRLSAEGRARLTDLLAEERTSIDSEAFAGIYDEFRSVNRVFKSLVAQWQLKDGEPNDHTDAGYDAEVLGRLDSVHGAVLPVLAAASGQVPRLGAFSVKLSAALEKIRAGDTSWFTRPLVDSYHTVWFELHEELIGAAGLTREDEARSGEAE
jgi:hypothetical protein